MSFDTVTRSSSPEIGPSVISAPFPRTWAQLLLADDDGVGILDELHRGRSLELAQDRRLLLGASAAHPSGVICVRVRRRCER